ncbi:unnamed protein product [Camellia sinensis]
MDSIPLRYEATHTRSDGKRDGIWYRTNSGNLSLSKECTILCYKRLKRGTKMAEIFDSVDHPIFPKVFALNQKETYTEVVIEKLPSMELTHWLDNHSILWTENDEKTQYLEMEAQHQKLFKSILEGLYHLHEQKRCHGNLLRGVWVSEDGDPKFQVKFADMNLEAGFHDGFLKDFEDLKTLVRHAVNKHDEHISAANEKSIQSPPALDHFYTLYSKFKQHGNSAKLMGNYAIFLYWQNFQCFRATLIFDGNKVAQSKKVGQKRKRKPKLNKGYSMPKMAGWDAKVEALDKKDPVRRLFGHGICQSYRESGGIYWICRNALHHYGEYVKSSEKDADQMAMEDFLRLFPEAIPCIFDRFGDLPERGIYSSLKQCFVLGERCIGRGGLESQDFGDDHNFMIYFP